jgi:hypothetical protein
MYPKQDCNFTCPSCDAKLLVVRIPSQFRQGERERATCPYCMDILQPRDVGDVMQYRLVRGHHRQLSFGQSAAILARS